MVRNQPVSACFKCYHLETIGAKSLRICSHESASRLFGASSLEEVYQKAVEIVDKKDARAPAPSSLQLWLGNRCNLKCRMCNGHLSSKIAADPLQSRWNPSEASVAYLTELFPSKNRGVKRRGFKKISGERDGLAVAVRRKAGANIWFPATPIPVTDIYLEGDLLLDHGKELRITLDEKLVLLDRVAERRWSRKISIYYRGSNSSIAMRIMVTPPGEELQIRHIAVRMTAPTGSVPEEWTGSSANPLRNPKYPASGFSNLISSPERIRELSLAGGEPMMSPEILPLLQQLKQAGNAKDTSIFMHTNGTIFNAKVVELLKEFGGVLLAFSLDGMGSLLEYIRYPAKWERTRDCLMEHKTAGLSVAVQPCLQAYNVFGALELVRFCDQHEIPFHLNNVLTQPRFLSVDMLPLPVIEKAKREWEQYYKDECRDDRRQEVRMLLSTLSLPRPDDVCNLQEEFVAFTNDLDRDRDQTLEVAEPRLYRELLEAGLEFRGKYRFAAPSL
jgi:hypothetical protein